MASSPSFPTNPLQPSTSSLYLQKLFFFSLYTTHFINLQFVLPSPKTLLLSAESTEILVSQACIPLSSFLRKDYKNKTVCRFWLLRKTPLKKDQKAMEQYFQEAMPQNDLNKEDESSMENWKPVSAADNGSDKNSYGGFDCNICLDFVQDPVVTLCGHLFCWPCIYKWLYFQSISTENPDQKNPQCPVCKAEVSDTTLIPLYGRGQTTKPSNAKAPHPDIFIPRRPSGPACGVDAPLTPTTTANPRPSRQLYYRNYQHHSQPYHPHPSSYAESPILSPGGMTTTSTYHPIMGMFGEMVYARVFGNSVQNLYTYPNSYHLAGNTSPRMRRHVMQADKSLSRICFFLFCCILLCLLLF